MSRLTTRHNKYDSKLFGDLHLQSNRIHGIDFSGAEDAGRRIWIASGIVEGQSVRIEQCRRAETLPGADKTRSRCLAALRDFIASSKKGVFGLDFPFGLPRELVGDKNWMDFIASFPTKFESPESFRDYCREVSPNREKKRVTDRESKTPFSPYNLRLFRQTYYGILSVLNPLVMRQVVRVLPMQEPLFGTPSILEICPASTLKKLRLYTKYKGKDQQDRDARAYILEQIERKESLQIVDPDVREKMLADTGGDALDSVIAALATYRAIHDPSGLFPQEDTSYSIEGYVYV